MSTAFRHAILLCVLAPVVVAATFAADIVIKGSNTFGEELGPRLVASYTNEYPDTIIELESYGSATGFDALIKGTCNIAASSRVMNEDERRLAKSRGLHIVHHGIGYYGVTVVVNETHSIKSLTDEQVRDIFTGAVRNWKDVGGRDREIHLYIRDPASGTYLGFQELAMERKPYAEGAKKYHSYRAIREVIAQDEAGIGYTGMYNERGEGVHALQINGIPPSPYSVQQGYYPYARMLRLYTAEQELSQQAIRFIRFVQGKEGQNILRELGYVPRSVHGTIGVPFEPAW